MLHACFVRSPFARAAIRSIDTSAALAQPGVRFVFTAADLNPDVKEQWHTSIGAASPETPRPPLAEGEVRFVGDPVALVVAESRALAEDAAELVDVDYEPLPAVVDYTEAEHADALVHEAPRLQRRSASSTASRRRRSTTCSRRPRTSSSETIFQQAYAPVPMEGRGLVVDYARGVRRPDDLRGDAVAARGAPLLLAPARDPRAPHPRRRCATPAAGSGRRSWSSATRCA